MTIIGPDAYLSKHSNENSYFADEIAPIPPRNTWDELPPTSSRHCIISPHWKARRKAVFFLTT